MGASEVRSKVWDCWVGSIQDPWYATLGMGWPLEARRSLFPDWLRRCDESSPHRRALHIPNPLVPHLGPDLRGPHPQKPPSHPVIN